MAHPSVARTQATSPTVTGVMVILTVKAGVTREQVMAVMPGEIRQTVQLYLNGKVREWYSRGDGRGVVFLLDSSDVTEAQAIMEGLPLAKQNLMDHEYISVGSALAAPLAHRQSLSARELNASHARFPCFRIWRGSPRGRRIGEARC